MTRSVFDPSFEDLPQVIPIFPLTGVLLLPTGKLPLNIFEPRYLAMVRDALADERRMIGMLQPRVPDPDDNRGAANSEEGEPDLYQTGCAGRITSFSESDDGRYMLTLSGICRFDIAEEMTGKDGYRRVLADYRRFRDDIGDPPEAEIDRDRLLAAVKEYFALQNIEASWDAVLATPNQRLITSLAMTCPFGPNERQALLEAQTLSARADIVVTLLEMALMENGEASDISH
ncbi:MAG: peptidase S16 [Rhodospirillaceae bacterium]|nr:peptidase S16 [Rhodospirillaceae bacterium]|tara:strand:- start:63377 stop:64069 length:693 start_codon:yes stop_codon:yes gene_type:complete